MSKLTLNDVEWKEFFIGGDNGVFQITSTSSGIDKNKLNTADGTIPYITRSEENNGINLFVSNEQESKYTKDSAGVITIGLDTQTVFYQPKEFFTGQNIQVLKNEHLCKYSSLFIIPLLKIQMEKFNWGGNGATLTRLKRTKIMLPIDSENNPDWNFMREFSKQKLKSQSQKLVLYFKNKLMSLEFEKEINEIKWREFFFTDIFKEIKRGKRLTKSNQIEGDTPYVSSTGANNGVDNFISNNTNVRKYSNNLSLANSGSVGSCFYHYYEYIASDHITALTSEYADEYIYKFMATIISRLEEKYSFNREINDKRISREKLFLPIDNNGIPHWEYMRNYVKELEKENIEKIIEYMSIYNN